MHKIFMSVLDTLLFQGCFPANLALLRTESVDECCVELPGEKGVRHVPEELLQQGCHIVNAVLLFQTDINPTVKFLTQLENQRFKYWLHNIQRVDLTRSFI